MFNRIKSARNVAGNQAINRAVFEVLENRRHLTAAVWTGGGVDNLWSDAANWQSNAVPAAGSDVIFPDNGGKIQTISVDQSMTMHSITLNGDYDLSGLSPVHLTGSLTQANNSSSIVDMPIVLDQAVQFNLPDPSDSMVFFQGIGEVTPSQALTVTGSGFIDFRAGNHTYSGLTDITGGTVQLQQDSLSGYQIDAGATMYEDGGEAASVAVNGGKLFTLADGPGAGLTVDSGLTLTSSSTMQFQLTKSNNPPAIDAATVTVTSGAIALNGATLSLVTPGFTPAATDSLTLIKNNTGIAVTGTFSGLPEGSVISEYGGKYVLSYEGGLSHQDVTLTAVPIAVWTGAGQNHNWSNPANWQGNVVPASGESVDFPDIGANPNVAITAPVTVGDVTIDANYYLHGVGPLTIDGNVNLTNSGGYFSVPVVLTHDMTVTAAANVYEDLDFINGGNGYGITKLGDGSLSVGGTYTGTTTVSAGQLSIYNTINSTVVVNGTGEVVQNGGMDGLTNTDGTVALGGEQGSTLTADGNVSFGSGAVLSETISYDSEGREERLGVLVARGDSINLTGSSFEVSTLDNYVPPNNSVITLIENQTGNAVTGTFANMPEGSVTTINGVNYTVSYLGGTSGHDVTLTVGLPTGIWTGGGTDNLWSDAANWQAGTVPLSGADVQLDDPGVDRVSIDVDSNVAVDSMEMTNMILIGDQLTIDGGISSTGVSAIQNNIELGDTVAIGGSGIVVLGGTINTRDSFGLSVTGGIVVGMAPFTLGNDNSIAAVGGLASSYYSGDTTVTQGSTFGFSANLTSTVKFGGGSSVIASGTAQSLIDTDGISAPRVPGLVGFPVGGPAAPSQLTIGDSSEFPDTLVVNQNMSFANGMRITFPIAGTAVGNGVTPNASSEIDLLAGTINLHNAVFQSNVANTYNPVAGDVITLIKNQTGNAITGTFAKLPEGADVTIGSATFTISYVGGESHRDVTLTDGSASTTPTIASQMSNLSTSSSHPALSILGADTATAGEAGLTYTWSVSSGPVGAASVKFSDNHTNSAKSASARFSAAGVYHLSCVITNIAGNSVTASVMVTVKQVATSLRLSPHIQTVARRHSVQYQGVALDQFGNPMRPSSPTTFSVKSGGGSINAAGLFTAAKKAGHVVIQIAVGDLMGTVGATVI